MKLFGNTHARDREDRRDWTEAPEDYLNGDDAASVDQDYDGEAPEDDLEDARPDEDRGGFLSRIPNGVIIAVSALLTLALVAGVGALIVDHYLSLINYQAADSDFFHTVSNPEELPEETPVSSLVAQLEEEDNQDRLEATPEELAQWDAHINDVVSDKETYEVPFDKDVYNILLVGTDVRNMSEVGRSDAMILVSINQKSQRIYLTSFLRDCYVHIPGYGNTRLNHAFAYGGPDLLEETLEENFKVHVDRYVMVNFFSFMDVVDTLGGVWLNVTEAEQEVTNDYIWSMNKLMDEEWSNDYIWSSGWQKLNGKQTLCYARNRYVGNDYERTQRQRTVLNQIFNGAKSASPAVLVQLAQVILPQVTTDMTKTQVLDYAANIGAYMNYEVVSQQIPAAGTYYGATISGMSVISLDLDDNIAYLQSTIYAGAAAQTAADFGGTSAVGSNGIDWAAYNWDSYNSDDFWGREEWADIDWDRVDFSKVDWYNIDFDTVDWTDYYSPDPKPTKTPAATTSPSASAQPSATAKPSASAQPSATAKPSATPQPSATAKPSATPKPSAAPSPAASPSLSPGLNEEDENG